MDKEYLKIFTSYFLTEQNELSQELKTDILEFIEDADTQDLMLLLLLGEARYLTDDYEKTLVESEFRKSDIGNFLYSQEGVWDATKAAAYTAYKIRKKLITAPLKLATRVGRTVAPKTTQKITAGLQSAKKAGKVASWVAIPAAAITAGYTIYKQYLSRAARMCRSSSNKKACMKILKRRALQAQTRKLSASKKKCSQTNDPNKCKEKINKTIEKNKEKLAII